MGNHFFKAAPDVPVKVFIFYIDNSTLNRKVYNQQVYIYIYVFIYLGTKNRTVKDALHCKDEPKQGLNYCFTLRKLRSEFLLL